MALRTNPADEILRESLLLSNTKFGKLSSDIITVRLGFHFGVDERNLAFCVDVERPTLGNCAVRVNDTVSFSDAFFRIAQDRVVEIEALGKISILFDGIATSCEVGDVEFPDLFAALTERLAFGRSAPGKGFGIPSDNNRLPFEFRQFVGFAVAAFEFKIRSGVTLFEFSHSG